MVPEGTFSIVLDLCCDPVELNHILVDAVTPGPGWRASVASEIEGSRYKGFIIDVVPCLISDGIINISQGRGAAMIS